MARQFDKALLDKIRQGQYETEYKGVTVLVKPIPEGGADGEVDPRLFKSMRMMTLMLHFLPKAKKNATVAQQIAMPRKMLQGRLCGHGGRRYPAHHGQQCRWVWGACADL